jgi:hypothetical protein
MSATLVSRVLLKEVLVVGTIAGVFMSITMLAASLATRKSFLLIMHTQRNTALAVHKNQSSAIARVRKLFTPNV